MEDFGAPLEVVYLDDCVDLVISADCVPNDLLDQGVDNISTRTLAYRKSGHGIHEVQGCPEPCLTKDMIESGYALRIVSRDSYKLSGTSTIQILL